MADPKVIQLVNDPEFGRLSPADQKGVLSHFDPDFGQVSEAELPHLIQQIGMPGVSKPAVQMEGMVGSSPTDYAAASPDTALGKAVGVSKDVQAGMGTAIAANDVAGLATAGGAVGGPALAKMATAHPEATKHIAKVLLGLIAGESLGQGHAKSAGIAILTHLLTK